MNKLLDSAMFYAKIGWRVLPVHGIDQNGNCTCGRVSCSSLGKHPKNKHGFKDASSNKEDLLIFFNTDEFNIGIETGRNSNIFVLDIDAPKEGAKSLAELERKFGLLPETVTATTGYEGSEHRFFRYPQEGIGCKTNVRPGLDVRGDSGFVVAHPSRHKSGRQYSWKSGLSPSEIPVADAPKWLVDELRGRGSVSQNESNDGFFREGSRNDQLFRYGLDLVQKNVDREAVQVAIREKNRTYCKPPLSVAEVDQVFQSLQRYYSNENENVLLWEPLKELPTLEVEVPELTADLIPEALRDWAEDVSERMQTPLEMVMVPMIVSISGLIGRRLAIRPKKKDDWKVIPNLWGAIIAPPSAMKTPTMNEALKFVKRLEAEAKQEYDLAIVTYDIKDKDQDDHAPPPIRKRYLVNDATTEKVGIILNENPSGLVLFRDELLGFFTSLEKAGREGDRQFYLEAFNGDGSYIYDRVGRGTLDVPALCISILGGIQPDRLSNYFDATIHRGLSDDGFLTRFQLMVYPAKNRKWMLVDREPFWEATERVDQMFKRLAEAFKVEQFDMGRFDKMPYVRYDDEAQTLFFAWFEKLESRLRSGEIESSAFEAHLTKYRKLVPALSLVFHVIELSAKPDEPNVKSRVNLNCLRLAVRWSEFLEAHAKKVYADASRPQIVIVHLLVEKIRAGRIRDRETVRNLLRHQWSGLKDTKLVRSALSVLQSLNWLKVLEVSPKGGIGAPSEIIRINPEVLRDARP